jgi:hypothetical protein
MPENRVPYYVRFLAAELERRKARNPRYSLRAFAKAVGLDASALSRILSGKQGLSLSSGIKVGKKLSLPKTELRIFLASIAEEQFARTTMLISRALGPLDDRESTQSLP